MKFDRANASDLALVQRRIEDFLPQRIFDAHVHLFNAEHFVFENLYPMLKPEKFLGIEDYRKAAGEWLPNRNVEGLFFGFPNRGNDRVAVNRWMVEQIQICGGENSRVLALASPKDEPQAVADQIRELGMVGIKPYHVYAHDGDTGPAEIEQFAPEWMWEVCHGMRGVLMLHIVKYRAIADPKNQADIRRLCRKYPNCRLVLAHVARSFNYRHGREGLSSLVDLDNLWVDTSAVAETEAMRRAIEVLGPKRVLFGSDYPITQLRGRCVALGDSFFWIYPTTANLDTTIPKSGGNLIGIESLMCLREACEDAGLNRGDIEDIFHDNALRMLAPHLKESSVPKTPPGPELWSVAWNKISGGTGLLSKRAEMFDPRTWPAYFSKCLGSDIWDMDGRRYVDFAGGAGAILLGYADPDVSRAVRRRVNLGTYCTFLTPEEVELADLLLELHPWAQRVRYGRGGGEAMTIAVRIARAATGRSGVAICGYHGWHDWYLASNLADDKSLDGHLLPGLQPLGVPRELLGTAATFKYNDLASFDEAMSKLSGKLAAVVMEPMRSQYPKDGFLEKVAKRCREAGGVFVVDEITSGWRFGFPGALSKLGVQPDLVAYAKAMSNGFPCAAVVGRGEIMDAANASFISSSYWTDGVGPAAAVVCVRKMREVNAQAKIWELGGKLQEGLRAIAAKHPSAKMTVSGMPSVPSFAFDLGDDAQAARTLFTRGMLRRGFLVSTYCYMMWTHTEEHVQSFLEAADAVLGEIEKLAAEKRLQVEAGPRGGIRDAMGKAFARLA